MNKKTKRILEAVAEYTMVTITALGWLVLFTVDDLFVAMVGVLFVYTPIILKYSVKLARKTFNFIKRRFF